MDSKTTWTTYYSYGGYSFRDIIVTYTNCTTPMVENTGTNTKDVASAFFNLVLSALGVVSKNISVFGVGVSALAAYEAIQGTVLYGSQSDRMYTLVEYNKTTKNTEVDIFNNGDWITGCISYHVWLNSSDTYQYYVSTGESELINSSLNESYDSESYTSAAQTTINNMPTPYYDSAITITIYSTTVVL